jgi:parallel beta-helix repeat protein
MKNPPVRFGVRLCAFFVPLTLITIHLLVAANTAFAQGSLTPPGAPAPTMKTLDQVEPRKEVNATNTPGDATNLFIISQPGSYYLSANITGVAGKSGIQIAAESVTLDLNGFQLIGGGTGAGIAVSGIRRNLAIRNGTIRNWSADGVAAGLGVFSLYENLRIYKNGSVNGVGLLFGGGSIVRGCVSSYNVGNGFNSSTFSGGGEAGAGVVVEDCVSLGNGGNGFQLQRAVVSNCRAYNNTTGGIICLDGGSVLTNCNANATVAGIGISAGPGSALANCTAFNNTGSHGIFADAGSTLTNCTARQNTVQYGIRVENRSTVTNCSATDNTDAVATSYGIYTPSESTISGCTVSGNLNTNGASTFDSGVGIYAGASSTVKDCTVTSNRGDGIQVVNDSRVVGNTCDSNGLGDGAGIHSTSSDNRIDGNTVTDNDRGIQVDSSGTLVIKNSATGNTSNFEIAANNKVGVIVSAPNSLAISGATGGAGVGTSEPWANISF